MYDTLEKGESVVLVSVIASSGSTPRGAGAKMLVLEDGRAVGTIGGGSVEHASTQLACEAHEARASFTKGFRLRPNEVADLGMICGGDVTVYFQFFPGGDQADIMRLRYIKTLLEQGDTNAWLITAIKDDSVWNMGVYTEGDGLQFIDCVDEEELRLYLSAHASLFGDEPKLYIEPLVQAGRTYVFGGGHVSQELVPLIAHLGFRPVVYEDRAEFADPALFPGAVSCVQGDFCSFGDRLQVRSVDYIVIMTRGHQADYDVLLQALGTPAHYVGLIGSRHKMAATRERLRKDGIEEAALSRIHNPIGIPIKAETPAEIAVSIAAELILHRAERAE